MNSEIAGLWAVAFLISLIIVGLITGVLLTIEELRARRRGLPASRRAVAMPFQPNLPPVSAQGPERRAPLTDQPAMGDRLRAATRGAGSPSQAAPPAPSPQVSPSPPAFAPEVRPRQETADVGATQARLEETILAGPAISYELAVTAGDNAGKRQALVAESCTIGRSADASDLTLSDPLCSRRHAEVRLQGAAWFVSDLQSRNGTYVNETRLSDAPRPLQDGDQIRVGHTVITFRRLV